MKKEIKILIPALIILALLVGGALLSSSENEKETPKNKNEQVVEEKGPEFKNDKIEEAITDYLLSKEYFSWKTTSGSKNFCVIKNLAPERELFPYYVWARCGEFILRDGELKELSGSSVPVKIDYPNELSYYDPDKFSHEAPRDGSAYSEDVKRIFPEEAREEIANYQEKSVIEVEEKIELKALKWFSSDQVKGAENLWERAERYIKNCKVKEVFQKHNKVVKLTLKNGETFKAVEPELSDIFKIAQNPKILKECGEIIMSTE